MEQIDWSKAPADATHYSPSKTGVVAHWIKTEHGQRFWMYAEGGKWNVDSSPRPLEECIARLGPWDGTGTPAVGTVIEALVCGNWRTATVFAVRKNRDGRTVVLFDTDAGWDCWPLGSDFLRPLLTAEEKAAQERQQAVNALHAIISGPGDLHAAARRAYDAGYRKMAEESAK